MRQTKLCGRLIFMRVWASFSALGMLGKVRHAGSTKVNMLGVMRDAVKESGWHAQSWGKNQGTIGL
jgi:hypothetical protein